MFQVALFYEEECSLMVKWIIEKAYNPYILERGGETISVAAMVSFHTGGKTTMADIAMLDVRQMVAMYLKGAIQAVVIPTEYCSGWTHVITKLMKLGVDVQDVYIAKRVRGETVSEDDVGSFLTPYISSKHLEYMEFHIADHCNLKCKACEHYSGLLETPCFPNFDKFSRDMERLHQFIDDISVIRILGGEPLLNPEIEKYVVLTRRLYPKSHIVVVTNAILLPQMPESFFNTLREQHVGIWISQYIPMREKIDQIKNFLEGKKVWFHVASLATHFRMRQTLKPHDHPDREFFNCFQAHCHNLYDGKIAACFLPFTTKYFNSYFGKSLPEDGAIDLWNSSLTTEELKVRLLMPMERCRYCTDAKEVEWDRIKTPSELSDWVLE